MNLISLILSACIVAIFLSCGNVGSGSRVTSGSIEKPPREIPQPPSDPKPSGNLSGTNSDRVQDHHDDDNEHISTDVIESFKSLGVNVPDHIRGDLLFLDMEKAQQLSAIEKKISDLKANQPKAHLWGVKDLMDIAMMRHIANFDDEKTRETVYFACQTDSDSVVSYLKDLNKKVHWMQANTPDINKASAKNKDAFQKYSTLLMDLSYNAGRMKGTASAWFLMNNKPFDIDSP